jgi:hypothetical protein
MPKSKYLRIYVPAGPSMIFPGSAIVGTYEREDDSKTVYFEGNKYAALNLRTFEGRLQVAASRLTARYPTTAKCAFVPGDLICVGIAKTLTDTETWIVDALLEARRLQEWLGSEQLPIVGGSADLRERVSSTLFQKLTPSEMVHYTTIAQHQNRPVSDVLFESVYPT